VFVSSLADYMRAQGEEISELDAHEILKQRFLRKGVLNKATGEVMEMVRSTTELDTAEFNQYLDSCAAFLREMGITVPDPMDYHEVPDAVRESGFWRKAAGAK
jgi:hypothetical protein